jgi:hypothetical protein
MQIILEIPIEEGTDFVQKFGVPHAGNPTYFGLARIDPDKVSQPDPRPHKPVAEDKKLVQQAGICCSDIRFRTFLHERGMISTKSEDETISAVREFCGVGTRAQIKPGTHAGDQWIYLHGCFVAWLHHPDLPEQPRQERA